MSTHEIEDRRGFLASLSSPAGPLTIDAGSDATVCRVRRRVVTGPCPILGIGGGLRLNGGMGSSAVEQLWQTLSENELALVCVRGPESEWADLMTSWDHAVGELIWLARETSEIAEQYPRRRRSPHFGVVTAPKCGDRV